jgi:hypothetical protein
MLESIFSSSLFIDGILPFVLVFTLIFAILERSKLLGDNSRQINAIIALVVGLILIAFPFPRNLIVSLMPFLAVVAVVLLVFMLLYGFASGNKTGDPLGKGLKITFGILIGLALIIFLLYATGWWTYLYDLFMGGQNSGKILMNAVFIIIVVGAILAVVLGDKGEKKD